MAAEEDPMPEHHNEYILTKTTEDFLYDTFYSASIGASVVALFFGHRSGAIPGGGGGSRCARPGGPMETLDHRLPPSEKRRPGSPERRPAGSKSGGTLAVAKSSS